MPLTNRSILLVEDNEISQLVTASLLKSAGATLGVAATGRMALIMAETGVYDIIILDLDLPDMSGGAVARRIREQERQSGRQEATILALSASVGRREEELARAAGMDGIMPKPLDLALLIGKLTGAGKGNDAAVKTFSGERTIDFAWLESNLGDARLSRATLADAIDIFPGYVGEMRVLFAARPDKAVRLAHRLGGAAANIGAFALSHVAARFRENPGEAGLALLEKELQQFLQAARRALAEDALR